MTSGRLLGGSLQLHHVESMQRDQCNAGVAVARPFLPPPAGPRRLPRVASCSTARHVCNRNLERALSCGTDHAALPTASPQDLDLCFVTCSSTKFSRDPLPAHEPTEADHQRERLACFPRACVWGAGRSPVNYCGAACPCQPASQPASQPAKALTTVQGQAGSLGGSPLQSPPATVALAVGWGGPVGISHMLPLPCPCILPQCWSSCPWGACLQRRRTSTGRRGRHTSTACSTTCSSIQSRLRRSSPRRRTRRSSPPLPQSPPRRRRPRAPQRRRRRRRRQRSRCRRACPLTWPATA